MAVTAFGQLLLKLLGEKLTIDPAGICWSYLGHEWLSDQLCGECQSSGTLLFSWVEKKGLCLWCGEILFASTSPEQLSSAYVSRRNWWRRFELQEKIQILQLCPKYIRDIKFDFEDFLRREGRRLEDYPDYLG